MVVEWQCETPWLAVGLGERGGENLKSMDLQIFAGSAMATQEDYGCENRPTLFRMKPSDWTTWRLYDEP